MSRCISREGTCHCFYALVKIQDTAVEMEIEAQHALSRIEFELMDRSSTIKSSMKKSCKTSSVVIDLYVFSLHHDGT